MEYREYLTIVNNVQVEGKVCISINYDIDFQQCTLASLCDNIGRELRTIIGKDEENDDLIPDCGLVFILDCTRLNFKLRTVSKIVKLLKYMNETFPEKLYMCIVCGVSKYLKPILHIIKKSLPKESSDKIVVDEGFVLHAK